MVQLHLVRLNRKRSGASVLNSKQAKLILIDSGLNELFRPIALFFVRQKLRNCHRR